MASGRIIHKDIHLNEKLSSLDINCRYLYIGTIVHADDFGRLKASAKFLKALIFPYDEVICAITVKEWRDDLSIAGFIKVYVIEGQEYLFHPNWENWQPLRSDRKKPSDCPEPTKESIFVISETTIKISSVSGSKHYMSTNCQPIDNQLSTNCPPNLTQPNLTEPKEVVDLKESTITKKLSKGQIAYERFCLKYQDITGKTYIRKWGKDIKLINGVLTEIKTSDQWDEILERFFKDSFAENAGYPIGLLISQINKYNPGEING